MQTKAKQKEILQNEIVLPTLRGETIKGNMVSLKYNN